MAPESAEATPVEKPSLVLSPDLALQMYRGSAPAVSISGLCYATPEYAVKIQQKGLPYLSGTHLTVVETIDAAARSTARHRHDFVLMAGPPKTQLEDMIKMAKVQFFSGHISPLYVRGRMSQQTYDLLCLFGPKYGLTSFYTTSSGKKIELIK